MNKIKIKKPNNEVMKSTADDVRNYLHDALKVNYVFEDGWLYGVDYDQNYVYFTIEYYYQGYYDITYRLSYKLTGVTVTFDGEMEVVKKETVYTPVKPENSPNVVSDDGTDPFEEDGNIFRSMRNLFKEFLKPEKSKKEIPVIKQFDDEAMIAIEALYCAPDVADGHNEAMSLETIEGMVESCNKAIEDGRLSGGLFHNENTEDIEIIKAWVNPCDCIIGETEIPEGQPIVEVQFHNEDLWKMRKDGELKGLSIGARKVVEDE